MRRTISPKFEPWHTFATVCALFVAVQLFGALTFFISAAAENAWSLSLLIASGFLFVLLLAILFLARELLRQSKLLLSELRTSRGPAHRRRLP